MADRDWQKDLERCKRATPGPWKREGHRIIAPDLKQALAVLFRDEEATGDFIVDAREGWPAALERVLELEAVIKHCVDTECRKCYNYGTCDRKTNYGCGIYKLKEAINNA